MYEQLSELSQLLKQANQAPAADGRLVVSQNPDAPLPPASAGERSGPTPPRADWLARVDAGLGALRRAVRRAAAYAGDTGGLDRTIAVLRQARLAESRGDSRVADILLTEALNAMNGTE